jgi:hypothetical protein
VIRLEGGTRGKVRVIGSLERDAMNLLFQAVSRGQVVLDLSEVTMATEPAVRLLAGLPRERCELVSCPRWLALWVDRVGRNGDASPR